MRNISVPTAFLSINAIIGLLSMSDIEIFSDFKLLFYIFSITSLILGVGYFSGAFLYQLRLLFLAAIGYFAGFVKVLGSNLVFSPVEADIQTLQIGITMYGLTSVALLGAFLGFAAFPVKNHISARNLACRQWPWRAIFKASSVIVIICGYLSARSYGPLVWEGVYGVGEGEGQLLGNLQAIGVIFLTLNVISSVKSGRRGSVIVSLCLAFYFLAWGILLRGGRLEFLSGLLSLLIGYYAANGKSVRVSFRGYLALIFAAIFMEVWGYIRSVLTDLPSETMLEMYIRFYEDGLIFAGTISGIATSFSNTIDMINKGVFHFQWGYPYLEYLLRTPPEFMYPDRPKDLSSIFQSYGYVSIGGFFELAEAYLNFGIAGVFFVPLIISFIFGRFYTLALRGHVFSYFMIIGITSVFLRGAWYQTYAYYKGMVTSALLFIFFLMFVEYFKNRKNKNPASGALAHQA